MIANGRDVTQDWRDSGVASKQQLHPQDQQQQGYADITPVKAMLPPRVCSLRQCASFKHSIT